MTQATAIAVRNIIKERKGWEGSIHDLCKKHGISAVSYYRFRKSLKPTKKSQAPTVIDIPLHTDDAVFIVKCSISNVRRVLGELNENR
jgi:ACT domain-containing protein